MLAVINSSAYQDLSICQIGARELDEDRYHCSMSTMYGIARAADQTRERRALASHPAKKIPELLATAPSQVWSWDITKLRGPIKGVWYHLYALIDIFSRYSPGWMPPQISTEIWINEPLKETPASPPITETV